MNITRRSFWATVGGALAALVVPFAAKAKAPPVRRVWDVARAYGADLSKPQTYLTYGTMDDPFVPQTSKIIAFEAPEEVGPNGLLRKLQEAHNKGFRPAALGGAFWPVTHLVTDGDESNWGEGKE